jgi:hypothetical protein
MATKKSKATKKATKTTKKSGEWGGKREGSGRNAELKEATTKSVVLDAEALKVVERHIKKHKCGFSEAVRTLLKQAA